jgi:dTMP kinase
MSQQQSQNNQMEYGKRGLFVSFEGNDGSGKTTQIQRLTAWLQSHGREVLLLREPGGTRIGEKIREMLLDKAHHEMAAVTEMLLYAASRAQLVHTVIRPAVEAGAIVICDRFVDSSYAYQGFGRQLGLQTVRNANAPAIGDLMPHRTYFLDLDADLSMARRQASGLETDRLENEAMAFHRRAYEGYLELCALEPERICRVPVMDGDTQRTPEDVAAQIQKDLLPLLT